MKKETKTLIKYILQQSKTAMSTKDIAEKLFECKYIEDVTTKEIATYLNRTNIKNLEKQIKFIKTDKNNKYEKKTVYSLN